MSLFSPPLDDENVHAEQRSGERAGLTPTDEPRWEYDEFRVAIVAYYLLRQEAPHERLAKGDLDRRAEAFIEEAIDFKVDFEDDDALGKLDRLGLPELTRDITWKCTPIDESLRCLDEAWDNYFQFHRTD